LSWYVTLIGHQYVGAILALWLTYKGCLRVGVGASRERGVEVERAAVLSMESILSSAEYKIQSNIYARRIGNIDSVVAPLWTPARYVVEIKSYKGIVERGDRLTKLNRNYRLWQPIRQVWGQCRYLGKFYYPVLWMPESLLFTRFLHKGVLIVNGDVAFLERSLKEFDVVIKLPAIIAFKFEPPEAYKAYVKKLGFTYDYTVRMWSGFMSRKDKVGIDQILSNVGGISQFEQNQSYFP